MHEKILTGIILTVMAAALTAFGNGVTEDTGQTQDMDISISADAETDTIQDIRDQETETGDTASDSGETDTDYETDQMKDNTMKTTAGDTTFTAVLADNSSAGAVIVSQYIGSGDLPQHRKDQHDHVYCGVFQYH